MPPGVRAEEVDATVGGMYRDGSSRESRVGAILGAGNLSAIALMDVIYKVFAENEVVVLKLNPLTNDLRPVFTEAFRALIDGGCLRIVEGGADEGRYLVHHAAIDTVHLTGSDKTHDAIVFGTGEDAAARKAENRPLLDKPISSELGNVTPVVIVPGRWSRSAFDFHAQMIASTLAQAGGYECITPRVLVTPAGWSGREKLLAALRRVLRQTPNRFAYYPGAEERFLLFTGAHPEAELLGAGVPGKSLPWALIAGVDPGSDDLVFSTDPFAPVLAETPLGASSVADFIDRAVGFCNDRLWGTLAAAVIAQGLHCGPRRRKRHSSGGSRRSATGRLWSTARRSTASRLSHRRGTRSPGTSSPIFSPAVASCTTRIFLQIRRRPSSASHSERCRNHRGL